MATPVPNATTSFWRAQPHELDNHRSTPTLPTSTDILIIGAGYTGASITHHLLEQLQSQPHKPFPSILILEAREACSGATGRNGGHLKPDPYYRAASALKTHGPAAAEEVASFEARQVQEIKNLVEKESIDCDFVVTRAIDVVLYDSAHQESKNGLQALRNERISTSKEVFHVEGEKAEGVSGVKGAKGCSTYTAATVWPYKLVCHLLGKAVQKAAKVIFASNAYTSSLLPQYRQKIQAVRGICAHITPTSPHAPFMSNSYILRLAPGEYDYLIPRHDGSIIVGGARRDYFRDKGEWYENFDDSGVMEGARGYFEGYMQRLFKGWEGSGAVTESVWTGIMGYSSDGWPHVGEVPNNTGQFICAGFSGHGMPQIFLSAKAVAKMVLEGKKVEEVDLPRLYHTSQARLDAKGNKTLEEWEASHGEKRMRL